MPARTDSTDVYLTCPCSERDGREVRITLRKFRNLSLLPSPACDQAVHQLVSGGDDRPGSKAKWARPVGKHRPGRRSH
jgi:hypothetical protein